MQIRSANRDISLEKKFSHAWSFVRSTVPLGGANLLAGTLSAMYCTGRSFGQESAIVE
jgi:hypothetical protein